MYAIRSYYGSSAVVIEPEKHFTAGKTLLLDVINRLNVEEEVIIPKRLVP